MTRYVYDALNRLVETIAPDGSTTKTEYDAIGRLIGTVNAAGQTITTTYAAGNSSLATSIFASANGKVPNPLPGSIKSVTDADGHAIVYGYNADGDQTSVTDPSGQTTTMQYDKLNRETGELFPDGSSSHQAYDAVGQLTQLTDPDGSVDWVSYSHGVIRGVMTNRQGTALRFHGSVCRIASWVSDRTDRSHSSDRHRRCIRKRSHDRPRRSPT